MNITGVWNDKNTTGVAIVMIFVALITIPNWDIFILSIVSSIGFFLSGGINKDASV